jgi:hypothetical protein
MQLVLDWMRTKKRRSRRRGVPVRRRGALTLTQLEARLTPTIPAGLADVPWVWPDLQEFSGYAESHTLSGNETSTLTVDQNGDGSGGTFTVHYVGSGTTVDSASGGGGQNVIGASGSAASHFSFELTVVGS